MISPARAAGEPRTAELIFPNDEVNVDEPSLLFLRNASATDSFVGPRYYKVESKRSKGWRIEGWLLGLPTDFNITRSSRLEPNRSRIVDPAKPWTVLPQTTVAMRLAPLPRAIAGLTVRITPYQGLNSTTPFGPSAVLVAKELQLPSGDIAAADSNAACPLQQVQGVVQKLVGRAWVATQDWTTEGTYFIADRSRPRYFIGPCPAP